MSEAERYAAYEISAGGLLDMHDGGVAHHWPVEVARRPWLDIRKTPGLAFMPREWLRPESLDVTYFRLLPSGQSAVTAEKAAMLAAAFGEEGELSGRRLS